jgi:hypothetical protein
MKYRKDVGNMARNKAIACGTDNHRGQDYNRTVDILFIMVPGNSGTCTPDIVA